jgi:hypothetical protein
LPPYFLLIVFLELIVDGYLAWLITFLSLDDSHYAHIVILIIFIHVTWLLDLLL